MLPCLVFEDEHLLVVNKPPGINTHSPSPFHGEGIYEWLRHREPRWEELSILHRLDKETSGVMVFGKTREANRALTEQFATRKVEKEYVFWTRHALPESQVRVRSAMVRTGDHYQVRPLHAGGETAETRFRVLEERDGTFLVLAQPVTGKTHQIRAQAAARGFSVLGDLRYGGESYPRLCLHAQTLKFRHPANGRSLTFSVPAHFEVFPAYALREALIDPEATKAYRLIHGAAEGWPGWYVDRFGEFLVAQGKEAPDASVQGMLRVCAERTAARGVYEQRLLREVRRVAPSAAAPQHALGAEAPEEIVVPENGVLYEVRLGERYSVGLFLDQRENRRRLLVNYVASGFPVFASGLAGRTVLNTFAYTCSFSVCAALAGATVTSLDLSRRYLEWGKRNFARNGLAWRDHDFVFGEALLWLKRWRRRGRVFDVVILDPPTFSQSKQGGVFRVEKDYPRLVEVAAGLVNRGGVLFASTNCAGLKSAEFTRMVGDSAAAAGRQVTARHFAPQPPDFPMARLEPGYLKTLWLRLR